MSKLLVKKKNGSVHIREKSEESKENLDVVAPNKIKSWLALSEASRKNRGRTIEDIVAAVIREMKGKTFKPAKKKTQVTSQEYEELVRQCYNKGVSFKVLDRLVEVIEEPEDEDKKIDALVQEVIRNG